MNDLARGHSSLVFRSRPRPVPGDLRISWRVALTLLSLLSSRGKCASLVKLHVLNDALRSEVAQRKLTEVVRGERPASAVVVRVEPALGRTLDLIVGESLAEWTVRSKRLAVRLTGSGQRAANLISEADGVYVTEKEFLTGIGRRVTEHLVRDILSAANRIA